MSPSVTEKTWMLAALDDASVAQRLRQALSADAAEIGASWLLLETMKVLR